MKVHLVTAIFALTSYIWTDVAVSRPKPKNPLVLESGQEVVSKEIWEIRKQELRNLVQEYVYGFAPENTPAPMVVGALRHSRADYNYKEVILRLPPWSSDLSLRLAVFSPIGITRPPVVLSLNKCGNHTVIDDPSITQDTPDFVHGKCKKKMARGGESDQWSVREIMQEGFALVTVFPGHLAPDSAEHPSKLIEAYQELDKETRWGVVAAWAWILSRAMDYIEMDSELDSKKVVVTGLSRRGKAALLAAALDERFAVASPHQAGTLGLALISEPLTESVRQITKSYPHWFNQKIKKYRRDVENLPVDQNYLSALVAPRPIISTAGCNDWWSSNEAAYANLVSLVPVYKFLEREGFGAVAKIKSSGEMSDFSQVKEMLHFTMCPSGHTQDPVYWKTILRFAKHQFVSQETQE